MKSIITVIILALLGAGAAYGYLQWSAKQKPVPAQTGPTQVKEAHSADDGHDHGVGAAATDANLHADDAPAGDAKLCATHRIPERVDAFCHPELIEKMGQCGEHGVPEALCTRCSPVLIAAFKAENDWCAEHSVPESQCEKCKGG